MLDFVGSGVAVDGSVTFDPPCIGGWYYVVKSVFLSRDSV